MAAWSLQNHFPQVFLPATHSVHRETVTAGSRLQARTRKGPQPPRSSLAACAGSGLATENLARGTKGKARGLLTCATARATWGPASTQHRPAPPHLPLHTARVSLPASPARQGNWQWNQPIKGTARPGLPFPSLPLPGADAPSAYGCCVIRRVTSGAVASWLRRRPPLANGLASRTTDTFATQ